MRSWTGLLVLAHCFCIAIDFTGIIACNQWLQIHGDLNPSADTSFLNTFNTTTPIPISAYQSALLFDRIMRSSLPVSFAFHYQDRCVPTSSCFTGHGTFAEVGTIPFTQSTLTHADGPHCIGYTTISRSF